MFEGAPKPRNEFAQKGRVDRVGERRFTVQYGGAGLLKARARLAGEIDWDHGVGGAVSDRDRRQRRGEVERETIDGGDEAAEGNDGRGARPACADGPSRTGRTRVFYDSASGSISEAYDLSIFT